MLRIIEANVTEKFVMKYFSSWNRRQYSLGSGTVELVTPMDLFRQTAMVFRIRELSERLCVWKFVAVEIGERAEWIHAEMHKFTFVSGKAVKPNNRAFMEMRITDLRWPNTVFKYPCLTFCFTETIDAWMPKVD